ALGTLVAANYSFTFVNGLVTIGVGTPAIVFSVANQTYGAVPFTVAATSNSTGAFTYSVVSGPATISGATVTLTGAGTVVLKASEAADSSYAASSQTASFTVARASLTVTAASQTIAFGGTLAPYTASLTGFVNGDTAATAATGAPTLSTTPAVPTAVGSYPVTAALGTLVAANYSFTFVNGLVTIGVGTPAIVFSVANQTYGAVPFTVAATSNSTGAFTYSVVSGPATISGATVTLTGAGTVVLKASEAADSSYAASSQTASFTVARASLTVTAASQTIAFGGTLAPYTASLTGFVNGDPAATAVTGAPSLSTTPAVPTAVGSYPVTAALGTLVAANYSFTFVNGLVTIGVGTPAIVFSVANQTYGAVPFTVAATSNSTGAFTYSVVSGPATISGATVTLTGAGTVVLKASEAADSSYAASSQTASFTVARASLTVTAASQTIAFGGTLAPYTASLTGFVNGDTAATAATGAPTLSTTPAVPTAVGSYPVTAALGTLVAANYSFTFVNGLVTIGVGTPAIVFSVANQTYGAVPFTVAATSNSTGAFTYSVVSGPATISGATVTLTGAGTVVLKASEAADSSYAASSQTASFTVARASLTVTAASQTIAFGGTLAPYTASLTGFVNGDPAATAVTGAPSLSTTPAVPTAVGSYPVTAALGTLVAANYSFTFVNGLVTIGVGTPAIVFSVANQTYGAVPFTVAATSNSTGAFTYSVVSGPATISGATVTLTGAGTVVLKASEAADSSYAASSQTASFTVARASLTVTAASQTIAFGGTLAPYTASLTGFVNGDTAATAATGAPSLSTTPAVPTAVGSYPVTAALGTLVAANYSFTFVNGLVTIGVGTPAIVFSVANQTYGAVPFTVAATSNSTGAFTYSVVSGPATISGATVTLTGAGTVVLKASEAADSSYAASSQTASFTVARAVLTVTAAIQTIAFGGTLAPYTASLTGFVNGDTAATAVTGVPSLSTTPAVPTAVGSYPVTAALGTLVAANYSFPLVNGLVPIGVGTPAIVFPVANQTYGAVPFTVAATSNSTGAFTYSVVSGPATISGATVTLTGAGTVVLKASEAADSSYAASSQTASFTVARASLTVTAASQTIAF